MDALQDGALYTAKRLSAQRELFEGIKKVINQHNSWSEHEDTYVQIPVVERHKACHKFLSFFFFSLFWLSLCVCVKTIKSRKLETSTRECGKVVALLSIGWLES